jgi:hypothetical protein
VAAVRESKLFASKQPKLPGEIKKRLVKTWFMNLWKGVVGIVIFVATADILICHNLNGY